MLKVEIIHDSGDVYQSGQVLTASQFIKNYKDTITPNEDGRQHVSSLDLMTEEQAVYYIASAWGIEVHTFGKW